MASSLFPLSMLPEGDMERWWKTPLICQLRSLKLLTNCTQLRPLGSTATTAASFTVADLTSLNATTTRPYLRSQLHVPMRASWLTWLPCVCQVALTQVARIHLLDATRPASRVLDYSKEFCKSISWATRPSMSLYPICLHRETSI